MTEPMPRGFGYRSDGGEYSGPPPRMTLPEIYAALDAVAEGALRDRGEWRRACTASGNCLEVRRVPDGVILRNSHDHTREVKATEQEWTAFLDQVKAGRFDAEGGQQ